MAQRLINPEPLQNWANDHEPDDNMCFKGGYWPHIIFVRDTIMSLLFSSYEELKKNGGVVVVSTHTSKSIELPVFQIKLDSSLTFTMRYNFHDWKLSIDSNEDIDTDFMGLFDPEHEISSCYCEGFPEGLVFGSYAHSKRQFTVELGSEYQVFTFFWILSNKLGLRQK